MAIMPLYSSKTTTPSPPACPAGESATPSFAENADGLFGGKRGFYPNPLILLMNILPGSRSVNQERRAQQTVAVKSRCAGCYGI